MAEIIDDRTSVGDLPLPNALNRLRDDVERIRAALEGSAGGMAANAAAIGSRAPLSHQHEMAQIIGLLDALASKMASDWRPGLADLVGVDVGSAANGMVLKRVGAAWIAASIQLGDVPGWQDTVNALIASAIAERVGGAPAALDAFNELAAAIANDPNFATTMATALGNRLRVDAVQALDATQKARALGNLGVSPLIQNLLDDTTETQALTTVGIGAGLRALRELETTAAIWAVLKVGATTEAAGVVRKATTADVLAGTADRYPDAAVLQALRPKVLLNVDCNANPPVMRSQLNVASVVRNGSGNFTITFTTPLSSENYVASAMVSNAGALQVGAAMITEQTAAALTIQCMAVNASANAANNPGTVCLAIWEP